MTDDDAQLRRRLARAAEAPEDDAFLASVEERIKRARRVRRLVPVVVTLVLATCAAVATPMLIDAGVQIMRGIELASQGAAWLLLSPVGALLALVAGVVVLAARR